MDFVILFRCCSHIYTGKGKNYFPSRREGIEGRGYTDGFAYK